MTQMDGNSAVGHVAGLAPLDDERALQELRALLLGKDQEELLALRERLDNLKVRAQDVSEVVAEALRLKESSDHEHELSRVLLPEVELALRESVRKDATVLAEALYPVMGPAIRKSIYEAIRGLIESFNEALSRGLSLRGLMWRIEAIRTGRPFAEVVLLHTLVFRVEQIFLIHKKTGLLLNHLATPQLQIQDPDMVAGMLSAIQEFVRDSFSAAQGTSVNTMQVGDLQVWVEQGPDAILASVIRGHAPQRLRFKLKERLEKVHQAYNRELTAFAGDASPFLAVSETLQDCFESQQGEEKPAPSKPFVALLASLAALILLIWGAYTVVQNRNWNHFIESLKYEPGITITSFEKHGGRYHIQGLRDPLSLDPAILAAQAGLDPDQAVFEWRAYDSPDAPVAQKRASAILKPPPTVALSIQEGALYVKGESDSDWAVRARTLGPLISGVNAVDTTGLNDLGLFGREKAEVESAMVFFPTGAEQVTASQMAVVTRTANTIDALLSKAREGQRRVSVEIVGHTDSTGSEGTNTRLSRQRAQQVVAALLKLGLPADSLRLRAASALEPLRREKSTDDRRFNRSVTFRVVASGQAEKR